jgi:hypothetical protein
MRSILPIKADSHPYADLGIIRCERNTRNDEGSIWRRPLLSANNTSRWRSLWTAARQNHDAITARDLGIDPLQYQHLAFETYYLTIVGGRRRGTRAHISLAFDATFEEHFLRLWIVVPEHGNVAARGAINKIRLGALIFCRHFGASAILIAMICGQPPASHNVVRPQAGRYGYHGRSRWRR